MRLAFAVPLVLGALSLAACERNKEVTADEVAAALKGVGYVVTPRAADPEAPKPTESSCFEMAGSGSKQSVCVWRCADAEACAKAMRFMMESPVPKKHIEVSTFQVDRCVLVERDCTGPSCAKLHDDVAKTHLKW